MILRKGQTYYQRYGFLPCSIPRSDYCMDIVDPYEEFKISADTTLQLRAAAEKLYAHDRDIMLGCVSHACFEGAKTSSCITYLAQECDGGTSKSMATCAFVDKLFAPHTGAFDDILQTAYTITARMDYDYCRYSEPLGWENRAHETALKYRHGEPTARFDSTSYVKLAAVQSSRQGDAYVKGDPFDICKMSAEEFWPGNAGIVIKHFTIIRIQILLQLNTS